MNHRFDETYILSMRLFYALIITIFFLFLGFRSHAQLSGTYFVNADGSGNYTSLSQMSDALNTQGISGDVIIKISPGTFEEQISLEIPSASGSNSLTIEGQTGNPDDVTINYFDATEETPYVFRFIGMSNVTVRHITFNTSESSYGTVIDIRQDSQNFNIDNNKFYGDFNGTCVNFGQGLDFSTFFALIDDLVVTNNYFNQFTRCIGNQMFTPSENNTVIIDNNIFHDAYGVFLAGFYDVTISNNLSYGTEYSIKGFELNNCAGGIIENNILHRSFESIRLSSVLGTSENPFIVRNNFVSGSIELLVLNVCDGVNVLHNSFRSDDDEFLVLFTYGSTNTTVANNIFYQANPNGGLIAMSPFLENTQIFNHNAWYTEGAFASDFDESSGATSYITDFDEFLGLDFIEESNILVQPVFESDSNLHVASSLLQFGMPTSLVPTDIDGDDRDAISPTIGADEISGGTLIGGLQLDTVLTLNDVSDGQALQVSWDVSNLSTNTLYSPWEDRLWLSDDTILSPSDILLDSIMVAENLGGGESYTIELIATIPLGILGTKHAIVEVDSDEQLFDDNADNVKASAAFNITESAKPDLVVSNINVPIDPFSGTPTTIEWTVTNQGNAPAVLTWTDKIYFDSDTSYFPDPYNVNEDQILSIYSRTNPTALAPGESYVSSKTFETPIDLGGEHYFLIITDFNNSVAESFNDFNNHKLSEEMFVIQSPLPDLVITDVNMPTTTFAGQSIDINYTVLNNGEANVVPSELPFNFFYGYTWVPLLAYSWIDYIYLTDTTFVENPSNYLGVAGSTFATLIPGDSYVVTETVYIPECINGYHSFHLYTDRWDLVQEAVESNNVFIKDSVEIILNPVPDLEVEDIHIVTTDLYSGEDIDLNFTVKNNGPANLFTSEDDWVDQVYLSPTDSIDVEELITIGTYIHNQDVFFDDSYLAETTFELPQEQIGDMFLLVFTDALNTVCESPFEDNNHLFIPVNISLTPPPDLEIVNWEMVDEIDAGDELIIDLTIENTGDGPTISSSWNDKIVIIPQGGSLYTQSVTLDTYYQNNNLEVDENYQWNSTVIIPADFAEGVYEIYYFIDDLNEEYEHDYESNNIQILTINVTRNEDFVSDLEVVDLQINEPALSGQAVEITYEVLNSSLATYVAGWYDKLFIQNQNGTVLGEQQILHLENLENGESYFNTADFIIPDGLQGEYFLKIKADTDDFVLEYELENNVLSIPINVELSPIPNLTPTVLTIPATASAGQGFVADYIAINAGEVSLNDESWYDYVYLSLDNLLDENDIYLKKFRIDEDLDVLEAYTNDSIVPLPNTVIGDYFVIIKVDGADEIYEHGLENDNFIVSENPINITLAPPVDFDLVFDPIADIFNTYATVDVTVTNTSTNPAEGTWKNSVYLSEDEYWDISDELISFNQIGGLISSVSTPIAAGGSYTQDIVSSVPSVKAGNYHFIIRYDSFNNVHELDENNNTFVSPAVFIDNIPLIEPDVIYNEEFIFGGHDYFKIDVPDEKGLLVEMRHIDVPGAFDGNQVPIHDIIISEEEVPTNLNYDYTTLTPLQENHDVLVSVENYDRRDFIKTSSLYIPPHYDPDSFPNALYTLEAQLKEFSMFNLVPDTAGNSHNITLRINGFDFNDSLHVELRSATDTIIAYETYVNSTERLVAYFDPRDKSPGDYGLYMRKVNLETSSFAPNVFTLHEGGEFEGFIEIEAPAEVRLPESAPIKVVYGNEGMVNGYDYMVVIAFTKETEGVDSLSVEFKGSENPKYDDPQEDPLRFGDIDITEFDNMLMYSAYIPIVPNDFRGELFFDVKQEIAGLVYTNAFIFQLPRSEFTVSGRMEHYGYSSYLYQLDSIIVEDLGIPIDEFKFLNNVDCNRVLRVENMEQRVVDETIKVAEEAHGAKSMIPDIEKNLATIFGSGPFTLEKAQAAKKIFESRSKFDEIMENPAFSKEIKDVFACIATEQPESDCQLYATDYPSNCDKVRVCNINGKVYRNTIYTCPTNKPPNKEPTWFRNPFDPNEIIGPDGISELRIVEPESKMNYKVYFENISEATAPAARVRVDNDLPDEFKLQSFRMTGFGFGDKEFLLDPTPTIQQNFDLGSEYNHQILSLVAGLNATSQKAFWEFTTIDPETGQPTTDPNGGFLPPNDSTGIGQAWLSYEINLKNDIDDGTEVLNQADIIFDQNEEIETNIWSNIVGHIGINTEVKTLPEFSEQVFLVEWNTIESTFTVPIDFYNVYIQKDDGGIELWKSHTTLTMAYFQGEDGHTYSFHSQGILSDGTTEELHETFDSKTTILSFAATPDGDNPLIIYPNPATDILYLQYFLSDETDVVIKFHDVVGRQLLEINHGKQSPGIHNFRLDQLPKMNGAFFVSLHLDDEVYTQRGVFLKE